MTKKASPRHTRPSKPTSAPKKRPQSAPAKPRADEKRAAAKVEAASPGGDAVDAEVAAAAERAEKAETGWWLKVVPPPVPRSGFVALVGRPNVGKSTLLNALVREKLAATTPRPQTTRKRFRGVIQAGSSQLVLVDTPGLFDGAVIPEAGRAGFGELGTFMAAESRSAAGDADVVVWVEEAVHARTGAPDPLTPTQLAIAHMLKGTRRPVILALNKVDVIQKHLMLPYLQQWATVMPFASLVPISAQRRDGLDRLVTEVLALMPEGPMLFPDGQLTDASERAICEELIREKVMMLTGEEVPYAAAVEVQTFDESRREQKGPRGGVIEVDATIHVERDGQKAIVVGAGGKKIKEIGTAARQELERFLGTRVMLRLFVKVNERWTRHKSQLRSLGYS